MLSLRLLGPMILLNDGDPASLPASRKTRALLAYLAATGRPHRRDRLCEMLWEMPDDPRGALRWSLSKIRGVTESAGRPCILVDRENVALDPSAITIDLIRVRQLLAAGIDRTATGDLLQAAGTFRDEFLADLDLPDCHAFHAWTVAVREDMRRLHVAVLTSLCERLAPASALPHARELVRIDPSEETAWAILVRLLLAAGRRQESVEHYEIACRALAAEGGPAGPLARLWREAHMKPPAQARAEAERAAQDELISQDIRFCTAADGVRIAYAAVGEGPPLVRPANWMTHLEYDLHSPVWRHWIRELSRGRTLIRYDERGNGLSDWDVQDLSFEACMRDLEAIIDANGLHRFPMLGISQGVAFAIAYAVRHPERVSHLVLYGGYARGWAMRGPSEEASRRAAMRTLIEHGWGQDNPAFRQMFTTLFVPDATQEQMRWFNDLQRATISPANASRLHDTFGQVQVEALLPQVRTPTLVLHSRADCVVPFEESRRIATAIPAARFVPLEGRNHILLEDEPAWPRFLAELRGFLK
jgi:DNA-binding SARP family transcriptional activator/pimeloyl-ACP methyl ester carboxylesterase